MARCAEVCVKLSLGPDAAFNAYFILHKLLLKSRLRAAQCCLELTAASEACKQCTVNTWKHISLFVTITLACQRSVCVRIKPAYVICFCSALQLLRETVGWKDKSERESLLLHCLHQICHELMRWSQIRPVSLTPTPSLLTRANRSHRQTEKAYMGLLGVWAQDGGWNVSFMHWVWTVLILAALAQVVLIVSNSCAYVQKLTVWSGDWTLPPC